MQILDIVFYTFIGVVFIQAIFYIFFFRKFAFSKQQKGHFNNKPVSVIVCAKNESENLKHFLPTIINQEYPDFEIVLINDSSTDDTLKTMRFFEEQYQNVKLVNVKSNEAFWGSKKYALTLGIKAATNDYLLFTDADCKPVTRYWIKEMTAHFYQEKSIILGYGKYSKIKNSFLNKLIRFETFITAIQYFSFAKIGLPYMGVGRNLAYTKNDFFNANGFINHMKIFSGDDDLFINQVANNTNTTICFSETSFTESVPKKTFKAWYRQKRRHVSTAKYYKLKHKILLALIYSSNILFWFLALFLLINLFKWQIVVSLFLLKIILQYVILGASAKKLKENGLLISLPFLEISLIIVQLIIFINNLISKPNHWK